MTAWATLLQLLEAHIIDLRSATPTFNAAPPMHFSRVHLNAVLLPDRTVLVSGGEAKLKTASEAALQAEIYNPASNSWSLGATATVPRMYHFIAMLLPDGRVITAGSNPEAADPGGGDLRLELYHPPYLFRGARPFIESGPQEWQYGATATIHTPQAQQILWGAHHSPHGDDSLVGFEPAISGSSFQDARTMPHRGGSEPLHPQVGTCFF